MNVDKPDGSPVAKARKTSKARQARQKKAAETSLNKAAFVRSQPLRMPAKDVVASAARLGMTMTPDYVHKVRSTAKARGSIPTTRGAARTAAGKSGRKPSSRTDMRFRPLGVVRAGTPEAAFRKLVLELGLQRAKDLLAEVERKIGALIRG